MPEQAEIAVSGEAVRAAVCRKSSTPGLLKAGQSGEFFTRPFVSRKSTASSTTQ